MNESSAHPVDDLDRVVVVAAAVAERVGADAARRGQVAGAHRDVDPGQTLRSRLCDAGGDVRDHQAGLVQRLPGQPQHVLLVHHLQVDLVPEHVLRAHRGASGRRDHPAAVRAAGPVERAPAEHLPDPAVGPSGRDAERVVVVVGDAEDVAQLVRVDRHTRALGLRGGAAAGVRPDRRAGCPGGPLHVPGPRPVRQRRVGRAELVGDVLLGRELHRPELLPGGRLVLAGAQVEHEVEARGDLGADVGHPGRPGVGAQVLVAAVAGRAAGAGLELHRVLVVLARHLVRAERGQVDAVPAAGVLHPVLVDGVAAVERRPACSGSPGRTARPGRAARRWPRRSGCRTRSSPAAGSPRTAGSGSRRAPAHRGRSGPSPASTGRPSSSRDGLR